MLHCKTSSLSDSQRGVLDVRPARHFSTFKAYRLVHQLLHFSIFNKNHLCSACCSSAGFSVFIVMASLMVFTPQPHRSTV